MNTRLTAVIMLGFGFAAACQDTNPTQPELAGDAALAPASLEAAATAATASNTWTKKAKIPTRRADLATGAVGSVVYAIGGYIAPTGSLDKVEAYDLATDTWVAKHRMPARLTKTNGVGVINGWLYVSGGQFFNNDDVDFGETVRTLYVYKPSSDTWVRKADMPFKTSDGITGVINNKMYVLVGGCARPDDDECATPNRLFRYDPATDTWDERAPCPASHVGGAGGVINGKFYVIGGGASQGNLNLNVYDPATDQWTFKRPLPSPQGGAAAAVAHNKLHVIGGRKLDGTLLRTVRVYDPTTDQWTTAAPMPTPRFDLAAALAHLNGQSFIMAVGGVGPTGPTVVNEAYAP